MLRGAEGLQGCGSQLEARGARRGGRGPVRPLGPKSGGCRFLGQGVLGLSCLVEQRAAVLADVVGHGRLVRQARVSHLVDIGLQAILRRGPLRQDRLEGVESLRVGRFADACRGVSVHEVEKGRAELGHVLADLALAVLNMASLGDEAELHGD